MFCSNLHVKSFDRVNFENIIFSYFLCFAFYMASRMNVLKDKFLWFGLLVNVNNVMFTFVIAVLLLLFVDFCLLVSYAGVWLYIKLCDHLWTGLFTALFCSGDCCL